MFCKKTVNCNLAVRLICSFSARVGRKRTKELDFLYVLFLPPAARKLQKKRDLLFISCPRRQETNQRNAARGQERVLRIKKQQPAFLFVSTALPRVPQPQRVNIVEHGLQPYKTFKFKDAFPSGKVAHATSLKSLNKITATNRNYKKDFISLKSTSSFRRLCRQERGVHR